MCCLYQVSGNLSKHTLERVNRSVVFDSLRFHGLYICQWNSPGKNTGVGSPSLLQGIFQTQGLNPGVLSCRRILYHLSHQGTLVLSILKELSFVSNYLSLFAYDVFNCYFC